jgi:hypothetical protein
MTLGTFFILPTKGPPVRNFFFFGTSDPPLELLTIHLNL